MFNVLIVDDDPMVAELNQLFISRVADFHCCGVAATIADAKAMLSHLAQVDLLLLDVYMHQESGLDLLPALRADGRNIDVIMMTSAADALTVQTALRYGVVDYLIKPFQFRALRRRCGPGAKTRCEASEILLRPGGYRHPAAPRVLQQDGPRRLPKGLTPQTLRLVCRWIIAHQARDFSTNELAAALQISEYRAANT
jgi:two-component system response regulator DcuR